MQASDKTAWRCTPTKMHTKLSWVEVLHYRRKVQLCHADTALHDNRHHKVTQSWWALRHRTGLYALLR